MQYSCEGCGVAVDGNNKTTHRVIEAWVPCGNAATNHTYVIGRELGRYLCIECYRKMRQGISFDQTSMF
jgi:hypothetical protein